MAFAGYRHVLVPVALDSDEELALARGALEVAGHLVGKEGRITLASVRTPLEAAGDRRLVDEQALMAYRAILAGRERWAADQLASLSDGARGAVARVDAKTFADERGVAREICEGARAVGADLIVMPTHSRRGVERVFLGSVAQKVAHLSPIPVLLIPARPAP